MIRTALLVVVIGLYCAAIDCAWLPMQNPQSCGPFADQSPNEEDGMEIRTGEQTRRGTWLFQNSIQNIAKSIAALY